MLNEHLLLYNLFPCGRFDIDTEGLIILTNDGLFVNQFLHPKKNYKKYYVEVSGVLEVEDINFFKFGLVIYDGNNQLYTTKKALLEIIAKDKA